MLSDFRFSRRDVRARTGWGDTQLKIHLNRLVELEYVLVHRGGRGQSVVFELLYEGQGKDGSRFVPGLVDVQSLGYDAERAGQNEERSGVGRPPVGGWSAPGRGEETSLPPAPEAAFLPLVAARFDEALLGGDAKVSSYPAQAAKEKSFRPRRYFLRGA